jgi:hypothetical protein
MNRSFVSRRAAASPMSIAITALVVASIGLILALFRDPLSPGFGFSNPFGDGLSGYNFDSPASAYKSEMEMEMKRDLRAFIALNHKLKSKETQEHLDTLKVDEEVEFKKKEKDGTTDYKVLFTSYKRKGAVKKEVITMENDAESGLWHRRYLSPYDVEKDNKELAKKMQSWDRPEIEVPSVRGF